MATTLKIQSPILKPIAWKGRTLYQITSSIRKNRNTNESLSQIFLPNPITKYYRREIIATIDPNTQNSCNQRISLSIRELDAPNGSIVYQSLDEAQQSNHGGIISQLNPLFPNNSGLLGTMACNNCNNNADNCLSSITTKENVCFSQQTDARRRCRSGGMIARKFQTNANNDNQYFTNSNQYLTSRNRKISQNQYAYIRQGDISAAKPGSASTQTNIYSPAGLSHCPKYNISAFLQNNSFSYRWLDGTLFTAIIPDGNYDVNDLNNVFRLIQTNNLHYYINLTNLSHTFLLGFTYNTVRGIVELNIFASLTSNTIYSSANTWIEIQTVPQFIFINNKLSSALGFIADISYPATNAETTNQIFYGIKTGQFVPPYVPLYYKPSNSQYAQQGGVSSSEKIARLKYNTVQTTARLAGVWGQSTANALSYGVPVPDYPNTIKEKRGFPMIQTPIIRVYDNGLGMDKCNKFITRT